MKRYPKYKDSGIEWLGEVPEGWEVKMLKWAARLEYGSSLSEEAREEGSVPVFGSNGIVGEHSKSITDKPAIIIGRKGSYGKVSYSDVPCFPIDTTYYIDSSLTRENIRWLYYLLGSIALDEITFDTGVPGLSREFAYAKIVPVPSKNDQTTIADFLDQKTTKIDELIKKNEKLIELLKEKRQAVISHAVTKGLRNSPSPLSPPIKGGEISSPLAGEGKGEGALKMKDSGIEWIGEIPEGWEVKRLKYVCMINPPKSQYKGNKNIEITFLPMEKVGEQGEINKNETRNFKDVCNGYTYFENSDVLVAKITPCFENGKGCFVQGLPNGIGFGSTEFHVLRANKKIMPEHLYFITYSYPFRKMGEIMLIGAAGQKRVPEDFVKNFSIGIPPLTEQIQILNKLKRELQQIELIITKIQSQIEKLKEYRQALISNVVTGKVRVGES